MLRFLHGVQRTCRVDVSAMDTAGPPGVPGGGVVGRIPQEPNPVRVAPDWSRLRTTADSQANRGLRSPARTYFSRKRWWS